MIIAYAGSKGLKIILDNHSLQPTTNGESNGYWFSSTRSEAQWIADWQTLARRYANNPTVIGADLYNEPTGTWGTGDQDDWARAAKAAGDAIGALVAALAPASCPWVDAFFARPPQTPHADSVSNASTTPTTRDLESENGPRRRASCIANVTAVVGRTRSQ